jgi:hypothetical protein
VHSRPNTRCLTRHEPDRDTAPTPHMARHAPAVNVSGQSGFATLCHEHGRSASVTLWPAGSGGVQRGYVSQCPFVPLPSCHDVWTLLFLAAPCNHDGQVCTPRALWHKRGQYMSYRPAAVSVRSRDTHTMILFGETHVAVHIRDSDEGQRRD